MADLEAAAQAVLDRLAAEERLAEAQAGAAQWRWLVRDYGETPERVRGLAKAEDEVAEAEAQVRAAVEAEAAALAT